MGACVRVGVWIFVEEGGGGCGGWVEKGETSIPD